MALHATDREGDHRNGHAHLLATTRKVTAGALAEMFANLRKLAKARGANVSFLCVFVLREDAPTAPVYGQRHRLLAFAPRLGVSALYVSFRSLNDDPYRRPWLSG